MDMEVQGATGTFSAVARHLGVSPPTVKKMVDAGQFPTVPVGKRLRIPWDAVQRFLDTETKAVRR